MFVLFLKLELPLEVVIIYQTPMISYDIATILPPFLLLSGNHQYFQFEFGYNIMIRPISVQSPFLLL